MPIKQGRMAKWKDIVSALQTHQTFPPGMDVEVVLPCAKPDHREYHGRRDRAYLRDVSTGKILVTAPSAYALLEKIEAGWTYEPGKKEGLWT